MHRKSELSTFVSESSGRGGGNRKLLHFHKSFHEFSCRGARHNGARKCAGLRMLGLGGQRFLALMALMSPPMSLTRDTDLAQRTVTLFGGAREGETVSFGVLTAVT
jgi:hypothetical protein